MNIKNGWLNKEDNVEAILSKSTIWPVYETKPIEVGSPTKHFYDLWTPDPLGVCWHYSNPVWSSLSSAKEVCELLLKEEASASWHGMISKAGTFYQCISFNKGSWHVGKPGIIKGHKVENVNRYLLGIEVENEGHLRKIDGSFYSWPWKKDDSLKSEGVLINEGEFKNHYFAPFTDQQISCAKALISALKEEYKFEREDFMYQHHQFDPDRKDDVGPLWMDQILPKLLDEIYS